MSDHTRASRYSNGSLRTCQNCARAKIRCIRSVPTGSCDRCERLGKACHFHPGRRANAVPGLSDSKDRRIDALEAKLDRLLAQSVSATGSEASIEDKSPSASTPGPIQDVIDKGLLTIEAASLLLQDYRRTLMPYCPFVIVPPHATAATLRRDKPFLFLAILTAVSYDNMPLQRTLELEVKRAISNCMIFDGPVSFETLQGFLVHLAWCQYHSRPRRFSQYLHLAISIITDLQLDRAPEDRFWRTRVDFNGELDREISWGREERRAVIGFFWFSSSISQILQKRSSFSFIPYLETSCKFLASTAEYDSDRHLLHLIQLQRLSERIIVASSQHTSEPYDANALEQCYRDRRSELDLYLAQLPFPLTDSHLLLMQYHTAELYLCQVTLFDYKPRSQHHQHDSPFQIDALRLGLTAARTLLEFYVSLPLRQEVAFNNAGWVQLGFAVTLACKLVVAAADPLIHPHTVDLTRALNLSNMLSRCIIRIQALITSQMDARGDRDVFYHYEKRLKRAQWWFESRSLSRSQPLECLPAAVDPSSSASISHTPPEEEVNGYVAVSREGFDFQWPGLFPSPAFDDMFADWIAQGSTGF